MLNALRTTAVCLIAGAALAVSAEEPKKGEAAVVVELPKDKPAETKKEGKKETKKEEKKSDAAKPAGSKAAAKKETAPAAIDQPVINVEDNRKIDDGVYLIADNANTNAGPVTEFKIQAAIAQLSTSGWLQAQQNLVSYGKLALPYLIDTMGSAAGAASSYNLGGHTKADSGRATRQRPVSEVCVEVATAIVENHSDYKGEIPAMDQKAWQEWWAKHAETVKFSR